MFLDTSKSLAVAKYILTKRQAEGDSVTPMQLIKLVYVAHGLMLGAYGRPLINEAVEAWQYGPVVPSVYHAVKGYRSSPVMSVPGAKDVQFDEDEIRVMDTVARVYGPYNGVRLSAATHQPGTPWSVTWGARGKNSSISNDLIENFYDSLLAKRNIGSL